MNSLPPFADFFRAIWGHDPFPWQIRLANQVAGGLWPEWVTLPTGTGKTSVIDIAIYALAKQAEIAAAERTAPVRIVFAVNRRIVVDEAFDRAKTIASALDVAKNDESSPLHSCACALAKLAADPLAPPLEAFPLRGGTFTDRSWARSAFQPLVLTTTLDQLGSRLLFRGYGVSDYARPIHAALLANDSLLILDEAHTATAFSQTLRGIVRLRDQATEKLSLPFQAIQLTATPPTDAASPFQLAEEDVNHQIISRRLCASKPFGRVEVPEAKGKQRHKKLAGEMAPKALEYLDAGHRRILIVLNRVATAETLRAELRSRCTREHQGVAIEILTGRLRPLDRDSLVRRLGTTHQLKSPSPAADVPALILIATQCIEVGADFDFDALLTELAPLDNLRQRFGRLNRYGRDRVSPATIFAPEEALGIDSDDPIYGTALPRVWEWLGTLGEPDFGLAALAPQMPSGDALAALLAPTCDAPLLLAPHLDLFCQTSPEPYISPDPSLYIHGPRREFPEVGVVLRDDLDGIKEPLEVLRLVPPLATESASIPLYLARQCLENSSSLSDDSGDTPMRFEWKRGREESSIEQIPIWRKGAPLMLDKASNLIAGDTIIIPSGRRDALAHLLQLPSHHDSVEDQFETAHLVARDRLAIRFTFLQRERLAQALSKEARAQFLNITTPCFSQEEEQESVQFDEKAWRIMLPEVSALLAEQLPAEHPQKKIWEHAAWMDEEHNERRPASDWKFIRYPEGTHRGALMVNRSRVGASPWPTDPTDLGRQGNQADATVSLNTHSQGVACRVEKNAVQLSESLKDCLKEAARLHDLGKIDPRFQAMLYRCFLHAVEGRELLAKSGRPINPQAFSNLTNSLKLPNGFRHELISAKIVADAEQFEHHPERLLLIHLIASHHGRCRSFAPIVQDCDPEPFEVSVEGCETLYPGHQTPMASLADGVSSRFWNLTRRFGWWGLPYLESLLRLADQAESANPTTL